MNIPDRIYFHPGNEVVEQREDGSGTITVIVERMSKDRRSDEDVEFVRRDVLIERVRDEFCATFLGEFGDEILMRFGRMLDRIEEQ